MSNYEELSRLRAIATELSDELDLKKIPDEIDILRYACRKYFISFCIAVGMPDGTPFMPTKFHQLLADKLQSAYERVLDGKDVRMIVEVPPQFGKSSMVSELFPAWIMGQQSWPVICASYGASLAEVKSKHTRDIVTSDIYQYIFPDAGLSMDSTSKALWTNRKKAMYKAVGRGAGLTGTPGKIMVCLPYGEKISTDQGDIEIGKIVDGKLPLKIWSYNHDTTKVELMGIEEYEDNPGKQLVEIKYNDGTIVTCTEDHPIFIKDKGYISASEVEVGWVSLAIVDNL